MFKLPTVFLCFTLALLLSLSAQAAMYTTYQAKIIKPDGTPLESASVNFRFTILDPAGSCILYTENFNTINMAGSGGLVYFSLGSGIKTFPISGTVSFSDVFNNRGPALTCAAGGPASYSPAANDLRKIVMQFHDGAGWQTLPAMIINHVPYAMYANSAASATTAVNSAQLNGKTDLDFVQVTSIPTCSASQALQFNGASFGCVTVGSSGGGTVTSVTGSAPIVVSGSAAAPVISISVASMSSDGYLTAADYAEFKAKLSASSTVINTTLGYAPVSSSAVATQMASLNLSGDVSGSVSSNTVLSVGGKTSSQIANSVDETLAATSSATANTIVKRDSSGDFTANDIFANATKTNFVDIYKPSSGFNIRLKAPTSLSANYVLSLPATSGTAGQVLSTDGAGNLSWINAATGAVVSVSGTAGEITSSGGVAPVVGLADVGLAGTYYKVVTDNKGRVTSGVTTLSLSDLPNNLLNTTSNFAGDISGIISNITVNRIQGVSVTVTSLTTNDILQYDGSKYVNKNIPTCSGSQYLTFNGTSFSCGADAGASGTITTLSVAGPISSTGGANPTLSMVQASAAADGYLSSVDWATFNNKQTATSAAIIATLGYTPANVSSSTQWITNVSDIYYNAGYVGVGTANPSASVDVVQSGTSSYTGLKSHITSTVGNATGVETFASGSNYSTGVLVEAQSNGAAVGLDIYAGVNSAGGSYVRGIDAGIDDSQVAGSGLRLFADSVSTKASKAIEIASGFNSGYAIYANTNGKSYFKGNVGIGTSSPVTALTVSGGLQISMESATCAASYAGTLRYTAGNVQYCNGTTWSSFGVAGAGITGINGSTSSTQTFANSTTGTAPAFVTANGVHTLNIPLASAGSVTAGLLSNADYSTFMAKITSSAASVAQVLGYTPASATALGNYLVKTNNLSDLSSSATARTNLGVGYIGTLTSVDLGSADVSGTLAMARTPAYLGDVTKAAASNTLILSNSGVTAGTYTKVTVDAKGRVTSSAALTSSDVTTALGFTPGAAASGVTSLNGSVSQTQTLATGTSGLSPAFVTSNGIHTLNIPLASAASVTGGLLSNADYTTFTNYAATKITSSAASIAQVLGYTPASATSLGNYLVKTNNLSDLASSATARTNLGLGTLATANTIDLGSASATGLVNDARFVDQTNVVSGAQYTKVTVDGKGRVVSGAQLTSSDVTTALGFTPGAAASGITSLNGSASQTQTLAIGTAGTTFNLATANGVHTFNIPLASAGSVTGGLLSNADYTTFMGKITSSSASIAQVLGYTPASATSLGNYLVKANNLSDLASSSTARTNLGLGTFATASTIDLGSASATGTLAAARLPAFSGDATSVSGSPVLTLANSGVISATYTKVSVNAKGLVTSGAQLTSSDVTTALGYTPAASSAGNGDFKKDGSVSMTGQLRALAGTVSSPGYTFNGDTNTGVYSSAADNISLVTSGTDRLWIDGSGVINLGTGFQIDGYTVYSSYPVQLTGSAQATGFTFSNGPAIYSPSVSRLVLSTAGVDVNILASGNVGIGTATPATKLSVSGGVQISMESATCAASYAGTLRYNAGNVQFCNGTTWSSFGVAGSGITTFNGSTSGTQTFANGTTGTAPAFVTLNGVHTLNIPLASAASVTGGLLSNADYTTFTGKITSSTASITQVLGYVPASSTALGSYLTKANNLSDLASSATARTNLGLGTLATASTIDLGSASATGTLAVARLPAFAGDIDTASGSVSVTVDGLQGRSVLATAPTSGQVLAYNGSAWAPYTSASSQWNTSGTTINYTAGNVGVGTAAPAGALHVYQGSTTAPALLLEGPGAVSPSIYWYRSSTTANSKYWRARTNSNTDWFLETVDDTLSNPVVGIAVKRSANSITNVTFPNGYVGIGTSAPSEALEVSGSVKALSFISTSDRRLKENIQPISGLESVLKMNGYTYQWKSNGQFDAGVIAQELEQIFPNAVVTDKQSGYKAVKYSYLIAPLINSTKELHGMCTATQKDLDKVRRELASVKDENALLKEKNNELENRLRLIEKKLGIK